MSKETEMILEAIKNLQSEVTSTKTELQKEMSNTKTKLQKEMSNIKTELQKEIGSLKNEVTSIKVTLENVTNRSIKTIAEGHLDLSRKLNEAVKADHEKELLLVRVSLLEDEVRLLKEKFNTIA